MCSYGRHLQELAAACLALMKCEFMMEKVRVFLISRAIS